MRRLAKGTLVLLLAMVMAVGALTGCTVGQKRSQEIAILYTGDVHCAVDTNIGYAGLAAYKKELADRGDAVLLVDTGDALQGAAIGSFSEGADIVKLMNKLGYCAMTAGNHDFDYGGPAVLKDIMKQADFPVLSTNLIELASGQPVFDRFVIKTVDGVRIALVGISTPESITASTPAFFQDGKGSYLYDFLADGTGAKLYAAVQKAVDDARTAGVDYVIALSHLGVNDQSAPYRSIDVIANTTGIDAVLDGHSHTVIECQRVANKAGEHVLLSSTGTGLVNVGLLVITKSGNVSTGLVSGLTAKDDEVTAMIADIEKDYKAQLATVVGSVAADLVIKDPTSGLRIVRSRETNLGDLCADATRAAAGSDIGIANGGGIRAMLKAGDVTVGDILAVMPYGNLLCEIKVTGQQLLDALEFGARKAPEENGGFLQVSGVTYKIDLSVASTVTTDDNGMFVSVAGPYRVSGVTVGGQPLDLTKQYTLASNAYTVKSQGDGYTMFAGCPVVRDDFVLDADALTSYITTAYKADQQPYADPYGQGRITIVGQ